MNQLSKKPVLLLILLFILSATADATESIDEFLKRLPLENIKILEREAFYSNIYEVQFEQPLDHENPAAGSFTQRLYISHVDESQPVVLVTEGYSAGYYYTSEPAYMLKCNQIIAEHRYFGESVPDSVQWQYLTTYQAASDHHRIIANFREFYTDQWITTGISKGGQSVMFHSYYYPDDVDARIPYVAPLNKELEDTRIYTFLEKVGPKVCRRQIKKFQKHLLKNQEELLPEFKTFSDKKNYTYNQVGGIEKA
ncbi:MAG: S28 family serine protease, partial [Bacteroidales bacterium]